MPESRIFLYIVFALSGFTGLIYESIWTQYLKLFLGHAAYAQALVLATFMGGIALGSWICSRYSRQWSNLLFGYALVEGLIGLFALTFHFAFDRSVQFSFERIIPHLGSAAAVAVFKWALSAMLILPQTVLLGMTFPLMTAGFLRRYPQNPEASISLLYFMNSAGAVIGVLASGFVLIRLVGLPGTIGIAGMLNIGLSIVVWRLIRGLPVETQRPGGPAIGHVVRPGAGYRFLLAAALITGMASFIYEVTWIRMLSLVLGSSTDAFELMLSAFILGLALGGLWMRYRIGRIADTTRYLAKVQVAMGTIALTTLVLYGYTFDMMQWLMQTLPKTGDGYVLFNLSGWALSLFLMFPTAFCAGMTLPLITGSLLRSGEGERSLGSVYAANTVGAIIGVYLATYLGMPLLGLKGLMLAGASLDIMLGAALFWICVSAGRYSRVRMAVTAGCAAVIVLFGQGATLDRYKMSSGVFRYGTLESEESARLVFYRDGKTSTVSMLETEGGLDIRTNGKTDAGIQTDPDLPASGDEQTMVLLAALPLSLHPGARTVANIGFGSGLTTATLLRDRSLEVVDTIEIERAMVEGAKRFGPLVEAAYSDPRSTIYYDDAKSFFSAHRRAYDIIISEPSNPWVSGVAGLFSEEFYRSIKRHLTEKGVFCQWLQLYEVDMRLVSSVLKALTASFERVDLYAAGNTDIIMIAGNGPVSDEPALSVLQKPGIAESLKRIGVEGVEDLTLRKIGDTRLLGDFIRSAPGRANSDYFPVLDQGAARTRFMGATAAELIGIAYKPLPVMRLFGWSHFSVNDTATGRNTTWTAADESVAAGLLRDYYVKGRFAREIAVPEGLKGSAVRLQKYLFSDCGATPAERIGSLYDVVALQMVPYLRPGELDRLWQALEAGTCTRRSSLVERRWISLMKAIGRHDAGTMTRTATELLSSERDLPAGPASYLVAAGMMGHLMQGDREGALELWKQQRSSIYGKNDPSLFFQILIAFSSGGRASAGQ